MSKNEKSEPSEPHVINNPLDPEEALLRQVITLGTLIKILVAVGGLLVAVGVYEVNQLDKLRELTNALQANVSSLQAKVDPIQPKLQDIQTSEGKLSGQVIELNATIKSLQEKLNAKGEKH